MKKVLLTLYLFAPPVFAQTEFVRDWLILGTFPNPDAISRLSRDYVGGEAAVSPRGSEEILGRRWILYHSPREFVDFLWSDFEFDVRERCVVYSAFFVQSPAAQRVHLLVGSDDGIAVWCNGRQVHFADVARGLEVDNDTVLVDLRVGWNTILLKVANGEGGYAASARFADGDGLILTAKNPFQAQHELSPPAIVSTTRRLAFRLSVTDQNQLAVGLELSFLNKGSGSAQNVEVDYSTASRVIRRTTIPEIAGGELRRILNQWTPHDAADIARSPGPMQVRLKYDGLDTTLSYSFPGELLKRFFEPMQFEGWTEKRLDDKNVVISRTLAVPTELAGLGLQFSVDIGDAWGSVEVNGRQVLPRFSGDAGELWLSPRTQARDTFNIIITAKSDRTFRGNALVSSALRVRHDEIERYLFDVRFAQEIYHLDLGDQTSATSQLLDLLLNHNLQKSDEVLKPVNRRIAGYVAEAKKLSLHMIGNAHIDMAWLWRYTETIDVTRATFQAALDNLKSYPDFRFSHGQAQSYYWIEQRYPEMFREIQQYVKEGRWEIVGGTWIESDANLPCGESLVRQYLYGKRYFKQRFGVDVKHGYYPDTFGHPASLPQILSKSGIETYTFFRPWEDERIFWWESADGSRVLAHHPANWYGTWSGIPDTLWTTAMRSQKQFSSNDVVQFFGVGDHGGGPTRRQVEQIEELSKAQLYPNTQMSTFGAFYQKLVPQVRDVPVHRGELNSVFEGCYTSQAMIKKNNRKAEALLPSAELFSAIAMTYGYTYPSTELEEAWRSVLFNQFHDILCGSGIHDVYVDAEQFYTDAFQKATVALRGALEVITSQISTFGKKRSDPAIVLFNPLSWSRNEPIELKLRSEVGSAPMVVDQQGKEIPSQIIERRDDSVKVVVVAPNIPSVGYKTFWIGSRRETKSDLRQDLHLENRFFTVEIDPKSGCVSRIYDKRTKREVLQSGMLANEMQIQEDDAPMSAWVIGLRGEPRRINSPLSLKVVESGKVRTIVRSEYRYENSTFSQEVILYADLPRVDFRFASDWQHRKRILKIAFPLNVVQAKATFDIPYGSIERSPDGHEVVAQKWVDLSGSDYGISLLNDSKYGFDANGNVLRLTALRSSTDPDPRADQGLHEFSYALCPHEGGWQEGQTVLRAYEFNTPVISVMVGQHAGQLPSTYSFIQVNNPNVILAAIKKCEDDRSLILRCYETVGKTQHTSIRLWESITDVQETNLIEWNAMSLSSEQNWAKGIDLNLRPTEIKTLKLSFGKKP